MKVMCQPTYRLIGKKVIITNWFIYWNQSLAAYDCNIESFLTLCWTDRTRELASGCFCVKQASKHSVLLWKSYEVPSFPGLISLIGSSWTETRLQPLPLSVLQLRWKQPLWMRWLVVNMPTVTSWHLPLTALFCMSVLCLLKSHRGQTCDDFRQKCSHSAHLPPGITKAISSLKVGYTWQTNKEEKIAGREKPALPAESCSRSCLFYGLTSANPFFSFGIYRQAPLSLTRSIDLSSNAHLKASQVLHDFFSLLCYSASIFFLPLTLLKPFYPLKFPLSSFWKLFSAQFWQLHILYILCIGLFHDG